MWIWFRKIVGVIARLISEGELSEWRYRLVDPHQQRGIINCVPSIYKYKCTNTQIQIHKYKCTNTDAHKKTHTYICWTHTNRGSSIVSQQCSESVEIYHQQQHEKQTSTQNRFQDNNWNCWAKAWTCRRFCMITEKL